MIYPEPIKIYTNEAQIGEPLLSSELFLKLENTKEKIIVLQGGGDALKTSTTLTWLAVKAIQTTKTKVSVIGATVNHLKDGALQLFQDYIADNDQVRPYIRSYNKTERDYNINNSRLIFKAYETSKKARGSENDYVFMNEVNLLDYDLFWELQRKCRKKIIVDYNPSFAFWVHSKLIKGGEAQFHGNVKLYIIDHRHNPFLSKEDHDSYENISDPERFRVYSRGFTGKTKGAIFNFKKVDKIPVKQIINEDGSITEESLDFGFGMDIGYTTDKTTIVKVYMNAKDHYYKLLLYKSNDEIQNEINENSLVDDKGNPQTVEYYIKKILVSNGLTSASLLWGDHDKNISNKLRRIGVPYRMAKKGPNSVAASISSVKRYNGYYYDDPDIIFKNEKGETFSPIEHETEVYVWATAVDILTGNEITTGEPVEGMPDHAIAAIRMFEHSYAMRFAG